MPAGLCELCVMVSGTRVWLALALLSTLVAAMAAKEVEGDIQGYGHQDHPYKENSYQVCERLVWHAGFDL